MFTYVSAIVKVGESFCRQGWGQTPKTHILIPKLLTLNERSDKYKKIMVGGVGII